MGSTLHAVSMGSTLKAVAMGGAINDIVTAINAIIPWGVPWEQGAPSTLLQRGMLSTPLWGRVINAIATWGVLSMPLPQEALLMPLHHRGIHWRCHHRRHHWCHCTMWEAMRIGTIVYTICHGGCWQSHCRGGLSTQLRHREHHWRPMPREAPSTTSHHGGICWHCCHGRHCWCHHTMGGAVNTITTEWLMPSHRGHCQQHCHKGRCQCHDHRRPHQHHCAMGSTVNAKRRCQCHCNEGHP